MPYIQSKDRQRIDPYIAPLTDTLKTVGDLNYAVTRVALQYLENIGMNYSNFSNLIGTLTLIPMEIWRRIGQPYEYMKQQLNDDLPEFQKKWFSTKEESQ